MTGFKYNCIIQLPRLNINVDKIVDNDHLFGFYAAIVDYRITVNIIYEGMLLKTQLSEMSIAVKNVICY